LTSKDIHRVGFNQAKYQVRRRRAIHSLEYTLKPGKRTKTQKTDANKVAMIKSIVDIANLPGVKWILEGT
jgi:hypothetical protein